MSFQVPTRLLLPATVSTRTGFRENKLSRSNTRKENSNRITLY
ncbi:MAG: hypothetical protein OXJ52_00285 [Oligoflexia bacterium]|nr:hypothetical protein [Oligoflexia bacterium]